jgi:hypothetical protein
MPLRPTTTAPRGAFVMTVVVVIGLAGCARERPAESERARWPWRGRRDDYVRRSTVWIGGDPEAWIRHMRRLDLRVGPPGADAFPPEALVRCAFVPPHDADTFSGATPKFLCRRDMHDEVFKVKWGAENAEIYADLAGTRLLWALGFPTDRIYPVRVECTGCADDPWRDQTAHPDHVAPVFAPAIAERQFPGTTIEEMPHQGWSWRELDSIDAPRAQVDALRLLAAFVQHRDSKADNQRLVCPPDAIDDRHDCRRPVMLLDDLGSAFGGPSLTATHKMRLDDWRSRPLWRDPARCIAELTSEHDAHGDGLDHPRIGDDGRRFLARLLGALMRKQVTAMFEVARAGSRGDVAAWVDAFESRRRQVESPVPGDRTFRCPDAEAAR